MDLNQFDPGHASEEATIATVGVLLIGELLPFIQGLSYVMATVLACCTLFLNRRKYWESLKDTSIYKYIKKWLQGD